MIAKSTTVEIRQVANGYVVMPATIYEQRTVVGDDDRLVFQTFAELVAWMGGHFTHRAVAVKED